MAAVMQEPLLCRMSVRRNVALGLRFRRLPKSEAKKRVDALARAAIDLASRRTAGVEALRR